MFEIALSSEDSNVRPAIPIPPSAMLFPPSPLPPPFTHTLKGYSEN